MNKTTLIVATSLFAIGIGVSSAYAISITLAGDVAVTEDLDVTGQITGPTITEINNAIANAASCPPQDVQHWDKIIFGVNLDGPFDEGFISPDGKPELNQFSVFDIKVQDDPNQLIDLRERVAQKLNSMGYQKDYSLQPLVVDIENFNIDIIDVDYSIICAQPEQQGPT